MNTQQIERRRKMFHWFIDGIGIHGIYYCIKYYVNNKKTIGNYFDAEEMSIYHFAVTVIILFGIVLLQHNNIKYNK